MIFCDIKMCCTIRRWYWKTQVVVLYLIDTYEFVKYFAGPSAKKTTGRELSARLVGTEQSSVSTAVETGKVRSSSAKFQRSFSATCKIIRNDRATEPVLSAQRSSLLVVQALKKTWSITMRLIGLSL